MTVYALAVHGSIKQLGNGNLTDTDVVTAHLAHAFSHTMAVLKVFNAGVGVDDVLCHR
jgi:hypothetical protein